VLLQYEVVFMTYTLETTSMRLARQILLFSWLTTGYNLVLNRVVQLVETTPVWRSAHPPMTFYPSSLHTCQLRVKPAGCLLVIVIFINPSILVEI